MHAPPDTPTTLEAFSLDRFREDAQSFSEGLFLEKHAPLFLVHLCDGIENWGDPMAWSTAIGRKNVGPAVSAPRETWVIPIKKREGNPNPTLISVGRARTCDIVLRYSVVSKLHAQFVVDDDGLGVRDVRSANGVRLNGTRLEVMKAMPMVPGDEIFFGELRTVVVDGRQLHRELSRKDPAVIDDRRAKGATD